MKPAEWRSGAPSVRSTWRYARSPIARRIVRGEASERHRSGMGPFEAARFAIRLAVLGGTSNSELYPGASQYINGVSYWVPDTVAGQRVVEATIG